MTTIWKFRVDLSDWFDLTMPTGATPLTLQMQAGEPHLWAEVNPDAPLETVRFRVVGTGHPVPADTRYVGTWQQDQFVWHLYQDTPEGGT
jgi:hypothetical protein